MRRSFDVMVDRLAASLAKATEVALKGVITRRGPAIERSAAKLRAKYPHLGRAKLARAAMGAKPCIWRNRRCERCARDPAGARHDR